MLDNLVKNYHKSFLIGLGMISAAAIISLDSCTIRNTQIAQRREHKQEILNGIYHDLEMPKDLEEKLVKYETQTQFYDSVPGFNYGGGYTTKKRGKIETIVKNYGNNTIEKYNLLQGKEKNFIFTSSYKFNDLTIGISQGYNRGKFNYSINGVKKSVDLEKGLTLLVFMERKGSYTELPYVLIDESKILNVVPALEIGESDLVLQYKGQRKALQSIGKITKESFEFAEDKEE
jgi:hypothetical protein